MDPEMAQSMLLAAVSPDAASTAMAPVNNTAAPAAPAAAPTPTPFSFSPNRLRAIDSNPDIAAAITNAAQQYGGGVVTPELAKVIAHIESSGNPRVGTGSYKGLFQLDENGFRRFGGSGDIFDPAQNAAAGVRSLAADASAFRKATGRDPTPVELYMSHQQGQGGVIAHINNPDQPAWRSMLSTGEGRSKGEGWARKAIWGNVPDDQKQRFGSVDNVTSKDLLAMYEAKMGGGGGFGGPTMMAQNSAPGSSGAGGTPAGGAAPAADAPVPSSLMATLGNISRMLGGGGAKPAALPFAVADPLHADPAGEAQRARVIAARLAAAQQNPVG